MFGTKDRRLSILDRFLKTDIGQELLAQEEAELDGQRQHHAEVLAVNQAAAEKELPRLAKATATARERYIAAQQAVIDARQQYQLAEIAELEARNRIESDMAQSRSFLHDTAPEVLTGYLGELLQFYSDIRRSNTVLPELKGDDVPGNFTVGHEQRKKLDARWQHSQTVKEFHQLVRDTITLVKQLFGQPITSEQAAKEIESHRRVIAKAQKAAGIIL